MNTRPCAACGTLGDDVAEIETESDTHYLCDTCVAKIFANEREYHRRPASNRLFDDYGRRTSYHSLSRPK